jgi:sterol desaturase/sphingolipid hydroxylase (fatty acid hydroxylase superfamily)
MVLAGFNPFQTIIAIVLVAQYQHWIHTQYIGKLSWLEGLVNTPSAHRVHHGSNAAYLDRNFGGILMVWDRIFGTYSAEGEAVRFGLTENIKTNNPLRIVFNEYPKIWRDIKKRSSLRDKTYVVFGPLSWTPSKIEKKSKHQ